MSETGPARGDLLTARQHLERRGYLRGGLPPSPPAAWQGAAAGAALWAATSATLTGGVLARTGTAWSDVVAVALALGPLVALGIIVAALLGRVAAAQLLVWGGSPRGVSSALGGLAAVVLLAGVIASLGPRFCCSSWVNVFGVGGTGVCAAIAGSATCRGLRRRLGGETAGPSQTSSFRPLEVATLLVLTLVWLGIAFLPADPRPSSPGPQAFAVPAATGRVAVVGVEGLSREDLEALAALRPGEGWEEVAAWGWVEVEGTSAPLAAVSWTSLACGASPPQHGVSVLEEVQLFGRSAGVVLPPLLRRLVVGFWSPLSLARVTARPALDRRLPTVWEMASRAGCPVLVGGWWGSWPVRQLLGEVVSERAWLGGAIGPDAVTPALAEAVQAAWAEGKTAPIATDLLARELVRRAVAERGPSMVVLWLPALDLTSRLSGTLGPLAVVDRLRPHVVVLGDLLEELTHGGYVVWLVGRPTAAGPLFAASPAVPHRQGGIRASSSELAASWLDQLGLPPPSGGSLPRPELSGRAEGGLPAADYGPPPAPVARPSTASAAVQREVLRSLGYLR